MTTRIKLRRDTAVNWTSTNPILSAGEPGLETDTGKVKYGDGTTAWRLLGYSGADISSGDAVTISSGNTESWIRTLTNDDDGFYDPVVKYDSNGNVISLANDDDNNICYVSKYSNDGLLLWAKQFDNNGNDIAIDSNGDVFVSLDNGDVTIFKLAGIDGTELMSKQWDSGFDYNDSNVFIDIDSSDNLVGVIGYSETNGPNRVVAFKMSGSSGSVTWAKSIVNEANGGTNIYANGIGTDGNGNSYISGNSNTGGPTIAWVMKLNSSGVIQWQKSFVNDDNYNVDDGDIDVDDLGQVTISIEFTVRITAIADGYGNFNGDGTAVAVVRLDSAGDVAWARRLGPGSCETSLAGVCAGVNGEAYISAINYAFGPVQGEFHQTEADYYNSAVNHHFIAKYNSNGTVAWQREICYGINAFSDGGSHIQSLAAFEDKFIFTNLYYQKQGSGNNSIDNNRVFIAQLPASGALEEIEGWELKESRFPGRLTNKFTTEDSSFTLGDIIGDVIDVTPTASTTDSEIGQAIVRSASYDFTFDERGSLVIPNDGEIRLTQSQKGWFNIVGEWDNSDDDVEGYCVAVDPADGSVYVGGYDDRDNNGFIARYAANGEKIWFVNHKSDNYQWDSHINAITFKGEYLMVSGQMYDGNGDTTIGFISLHDKDTGREVPQESYTFFDNEGDDDDLYIVETLPLDITNNSNLFAVGMKYGGWQPVPEVTKLSGGTGYYVTARSDVVSNDNTYEINSNWRIMGTGITGSEQIAGINRYNGLTGTVPQGSSATFDIVANDGDPGVYTVSVNNGGSGYLPGHQIKVLGSALGGADGTNDLIITVATATEGVINTTTSSGTADGGSMNAYTAVAGTNYNTGTGLTFDFTYYTEVNNYNNYWDAFNWNGGSNYVVGDVVTIPGTQLGGTSPNHDMTVTVTGVDGSGAINNYNINGTPQANTVKIDTYSSVDFSGSGTWAFYQATNKDAMITVMDDWLKTFHYGDPDSYEEVFGAAKDGTGNAYVIGTSRNDNVFNGNEFAYVAKFNMTTGAHVWSKTINQTENNYANGKSIAVNGTVIATAHYDNWDGDTIITKLDLEGNVKWQRTVDADECSVAVDNEGNIIVVADDYWTRNNGYSIYKFGPGGEPIWKRYLRSQYNSSYSNQARNLVVDDTHLYLTGYTYAPTDNNYNAVLVKLPLDGSGTGVYTYWIYQVSDMNSYKQTQTDGQIDITSYYVENTVANVNWNADAGLYSLVGYTQKMFDEIRDTDGGKVMFADGSVQDTSGQDIPQRQRNGGDYLLGMNDRGRHILCTNANGNHRILVPHNDLVPFPIGTVITIVNDSESTIYIQSDDENSDIELVQPGEDNYWAYYLSNPGICTLLKTAPNRWFISGNPLGQD